jgi:hypothetical protein
MTISFSDTTLFGKNFSTDVKQMHSCIIFLTIKKALDNKGNIIPSKLDEISKAYLWQYIYYLRLNNLKHPVFKESSGYKALSAQQFYNMIEIVLGNKKSSTPNSATKLDLLNFLNILFKSNNNISIPFLESQKKANVVIQDFNKLKQTNAFDKKELKLSHNVVIVTNSVNVNGKNTNIRVSFNVINVDKNSNTNTKKLQQVEKKSIFNRFF